MKLRIAKRCGTHLSSRVTASQLRCDIFSHIFWGRAETITLDFAGVESMSDSFLDELFAVLVDERGDLWFKAHIRVENLTPEDRADLNRVIAQRLTRGWWA